MVLGLCVCGGGWTLEARLQVCVLECKCSAWPVCPCKLEGVRRDVACHGAGAVPRCAMLYCAVLCRKKRVQYSSDSSGYESGGSEEGLSFEERRRRARRAGRFGGGGGGGGAYGAGGRCGGLHGAARNSGEAAGRGWRALCVRGLLGAAGAAPRKCACQASNIHLLTTLHAAACHRVL